MAVKTFFFIITLSFIFTFNGFAVEELSSVSAEYMNKTYKKALNAFNSHKYEESLNYIRHVIKADMRDYRLRYLAAHNHWRKKNYNSAEIHFQTAIAVKPIEASGYIDLSLLYLEQNKWLLALNRANRGIAVLISNQKPVPAKLYNITARVHLYRGLFSQALAQAQAAKVAHLKYPRKEQKSSAVIKDRLESIILEARAQMGLRKFEEADLDLTWAANLSAKLQKENPYLDNLTGYYFELRAATLQNLTTKDAIAKRRSFLAKANKFYQKALSASNHNVFLKRTIEQNLSRVK